jgi:hypothetical protein
MRSIGLHYRRNEQLHDERSITYGPSPAVQANPATSPDVKPECRGLSASSGTAAFCPHSANGRSQKRPEALRINTMSRGQNMDYCRGFWSSPDAFGDQIENFKTAVRRWSRRGWVRFPRRSATYFSRGFLTVSVVSALVLLPFPDGAGARSVPTLLGPLLLESFLGRVEVRIDAAGNGLLHARGHMSVSFARLSSPTCTGL